MFLRLFQNVVFKNEFSTKVSLQRKYYCIFTKRLHFKNYSPQNRTGSNFQSFKNNLKQSKLYSISSNQSEIDFELVCNETLESLCEYFDQIVEDSSQLDNPDITFTDGVLTIQLGEPYGTYVINRQTPNKQIWLSSPTSGPKRYDFNGSKWIYKHDGVSLHELLTNELSLIISPNINFSKCIFSGDISK